MAAQYRAVDNRRIYRHAGRGNVQTRGERESGGREREREWREREREGREREREKYR